MADAPSPRASLVDALHRAGLRIAYRLLLAAWFVFRPRRRGVFVAVWHDGRILLIRNSYRRGLTLPAGGLWRGETAEDAALRELHEEVGLVAGLQALRFAREIPSRFEYKRDRCSFFELRLAAPVEPRVDHREVVWAAFVPRDDALRAALVPPVRAYLEGC